MTGAEPLIAILVALLAVAGLTWAFAFIWTAQVQRGYLERVSHVERRLDSADADLTEIARTANQATPSDPPPYGPAAQDLQQRMQRVQESFANCEAQLVTLRRSEPHLPVELPQRILAMASQLGAWRRHQSAIQVLAQQVSTLEKQLAGAQQQAEQLRNLPLGVAGRVRSAQGAIERTVRMCQSLRQAGVRGDALDTLVDTARTHGGVIESIPAYFLQGGDDAILRTATQESTSDAWRKLNNIEKSIFDALRRAQNWQDQYNESRNMVGAMQAEVSAAERILTGLPPSIDASDHAQQFNDLRSKVLAVQADWRAPEVHRLSEISNTATRHAVGARELAADMMLVHKTFQEFEQAIADNAEALNRIQTTLDTLGKSQVCPVHWTDCAAEYKRLGTSRATLGDGSTSRDPTRLEIDLDRALDLGLQIGALEARVNDVRGRHQQLLTLLANPEFATLEQWFHDAAALYIDASRYAAENWPVEDGITSLKTDAAALLGTEKGLAPLISNQLLPEADVQQWIDRTSGYVNGRREFASRVSSIERTLGTVERTEQSSQSLLSQVSEALARLNQGLVQSLSTPEVVRAWNEVMTRLEEGRDHTDTLQDRNTGRAVDKAMTITAWANQSTLDLHDLDEAVEAEVKGAEAQLNEEVESLLTVAPFDSEQSMATAQQLLTEIPARPIGADSGASGGVGGAVTAGVLSEKINAAFERHTRLTESLSDLDHHVMAQLEPRVTRLDAAHEAAWNKLQELRTLLQQLPDTHPLKVSCDEADQLEDAFKKAEASLDDLHDSGHTARSVVSRLDSLIQQFQYIANQGAAVQSDLEREVLRLRSTVDQLGRWMRDLKRFRSTQSADKVLAGVIDQRLAEIDAAFADVERRYNNQPLPLEHANQELERMLASLRGNLEVSRDTGVEVVSAQEIQSA